MIDSLTISGIVATEPRHVTTAQGLPITSFRLASQQRKYDRVTGLWSDGDTNWYTVTAFRQLAANVALSVKKGERLMVSGRLRIRSWQKDDRSGTSVEVEADSIGHDLSWGTATYTRGVSSASTVGAPETINERDLTKRNDQREVTGVNTQGKITELQGQQEFADLPIPQEALDSEGESALSVPF
ncbi:single-stranded DNA-binding protein [Lysinibacter sp. HNR]|uniref:single-stranded DNA-binding protein n=1 Tax=Lysinibacter sp. HNR TaxID=3031408 RepID=UPI002434CC4D|nr:single-stranded DNA-binding protein [Lysinibacter sp. HNR]WGD36442.1 single-stranded DNA-binding protein [Lysinibacter sp. HNR]